MIGKMIGKMVGKIIGLFLLIIVIFVIYMKKIENSDNTNNSKESWDNVKLESYLPIYSNNQKQEFNRDNQSVKRTTYDNGYKLENDNKQCVYQCKSKTACNRNTPTSTPDPNKIRPFGYRINYYPWFIQY